MAWQDGYPTANAAHPDPALVNLFRGMRQDARSDPKPAELARTFTIDIGFDGAGLLPTIGQCQILPLGYLRAHIVDASIVANGVGSATIDLRVGTSSDLPTLRPLYGSSAANIPTLTSVAYAPLDITNWTLNLQPHDIIMATLTSVSSAIASPAVGAMTSLTISLFCRHLKWPAGSVVAVDGSGDVAVDSSGHIVTGRS